MGTYHDAKRGTGLVLTCSDMRLQGRDDLVKHIPECFGELLPMRLDAIKVPGACFGLARGSAVEKEMLGYYVSLLVDLHQPETILLVQHMDCGRYGQLEGGCNEGILLADMEIVARVLGERFPRLTVFRAIADVDHEKTVGMSKVGMRVAE